MERETNIEGLEGSMLGKFYSHQRKIKSLADKFIKTGLIVGGLSVVGGLTGDRPFRSRDVQFNQAVSECDEAQGYLKRKIPANPMNPETQTGNTIVVRDCYDLNRYGEKSNFYAILGGFLAFGALATMGTSVAFKYTLPKVDGESVQREFKRFYGETQ